MLPEERCTVALVEFETTGKLKFIEPSYNDGRNYTEVHLARVENRAFVRVNICKINSDVQYGEPQVCDHEEVIQRFCDWIFV